MTDELVKRHVEQLRMTGGDLADLCQPLADAIEALTAERDRLRGGIEYVLDGYGLNGPDYRFQDGEDGDWISDRLVAALKGESHDR